MVDLEDGSYEVGVTLEGGSGRASVASPAPLDVEDGQATATITWSSPHYDYMVVDGQRLLPVNEGGNSTFEVPVASLDEPLGVVADTTAMSKPHEISYTLVFDAGSVHARTQTTAAVMLPVTLGLAVAVAAMFAIIRVRHTRKHA